MGSGSRRARKSLAPGPPSSTVTIVATPATGNPNSVSSSVTVANYHPDDPAAGMPLQLTSPSAPPPGEWLETSTIFPLGLHSLMHLDRVYVDRFKGSLEAMRAWDTEKRYRISDRNGRELFSAMEESSACARCCMGRCNSWRIHVFDSERREVLSFQRSLGSSSCLLPCCFQKLTVFSHGTMLGTVTMNWNPFRSSFAIRDAAGEKVLLIKGPPSWRCSGEAQFQIKSTDQKHKVGAIVKKCTKIAREFYKDGNAFLVAFPDDLDVKIKAVTIGACFLLEFMYFDKHPYKECIRDGSFEASCK